MICWKNSFDMWTAVHNRRTCEVWLCVLVFHLLRRVRKCNKIPDILYVQVTVHRHNLRINNQQDASSIQDFILSRNSPCFGHLLCPSSGVTSCTRGSWYVSCTCTADNSWWWAQKMPETCRVSWQNKIWILDASCSLFIRRKSLMLEL